MPRISKDKEATLYAPYAKDIRNLLTSFLEKNSFNFADFKEEWKAQKFSLIHMGKPDDVSGKVYLQELYTTCVGYLLLQDGSQSDALKLRVAVLFMLFCLYQTQTHKPKVKINVSIEVFQELCKLREEVKRKVLIDAFHILNQLGLQNAFAYCAVVKIDTMLSSLNTPQKQVTPIPQELEHFDTLQGVILSSRIKQLSEQYAAAKQSYSVQNNLQPISSGAMNALNIVKLNFVNEDLERLVHQFHQNKPIRNQAFLEETTPKPTTARGANNAKNAAAPASPPDPPVARGRPPTRQPANVSTMQFVRALFPRMGQAAESSDEEDAAAAGLDQQQQQAATPLPQQQSLVGENGQEVQVKQEPIDEEERQRRMQALQVNSERRESRAQVAQMIEAFLDGRSVALSIPVDDDDSGKKKRKKKSKEGSETAAAADSSAKPKKAPRKRKEKEPGEKTPKPKKTAKRKKTAATEPAAATPTSSLSSLIPLSVIEAGAGEASSSAAASFVNFVQETPKEKPAKRKKKEVAVTKTAASEKPKRQPKKKKPDDDFIVD